MKSPMILCAALAFGLSACAADSGYRSYGYNDSYSSYRAPRCNS